MKGKKVNLRKERGKVISSSSFSCKREEGKGRSRGNVQIHFRWKENLENCICSPLNGKKSKYFFSRSPTLSSVGCRPPPSKKPFFCFPRNNHNLVTWSEQEAPGRSLLFRQIKFLSPFLSLSCGKSKVAAAAAKAKAKETWMIFFAGNRGYVHYAVFPPKIQKIFFDSVRCVKNT